MAKIKVQSKMSMVTAIILTAVLLLFIGFMLFITGLSVHIHSDHGLAGIVVLASIFIPMWIKNASEKEEYVSEMMVSDNELTLVYKQRKNVRYKNIPLNEIKNFHAILTADNVASGRSVTLLCKTDVAIDTGSETIKFQETPTSSLSFCNYAFMLRLLSVSSMIPNFSYEVMGNAKVVQADVAHYAQYGKGLSVMEKQKVSFQTMPTSGKIGTYIGIFAILLVLGLFGYAFYLTMPASDSDLNANESEFMQHYNTAYSLGQSDNYQAAIAELDKAEAIYNKDPQLYVQKSYYYKEMNDYTNALKTAKEGLLYLNSESIYKKAKNLRIPLSNDIALYTTIGDSSIGLKNYQEGVGAFSYIIANGHYMYTDAYFKRGICEFYLGQKDAALKDFTKHKEIVQKYLQERAQARYPTYTINNLNNIELWIKACA